LTRLASIGEPIVPVPTNPTFMLTLLVPAEGCQA
jgi:hypothetical protein